MRFEYTGQPTRCVRFPQGGRRNGYTVRTSRIAPDEFSGCRTMRTAAREVGTGSGPASPHAEPFRVYYARGRPVCPRGGDRLDSPALYPSIEQDTYAVDRSALTHSDTFVRRHVGPDAAEVARMLETLGYGS